MINEAVETVLDAVSGLSLQEALQVLSTATRRLSRAAMRIQTRLALEQDALLTAADEDMSLEGLDDLDFDLEDIVHEAVEGRR